MFEISHIEQYREGNRLEAKDARGGLPKSVWASYSAFANTAGGVIVLGVRETASHELVCVGLDDPEALLRDFWNAVNNRDVVSAKVLSDDDASVEEVPAGRIVVIRVPRAPHKDKPVFVRGNPLTGTYRRNGEGDYHCSSDEVRAMMRDAGSGLADAAPVATMELDALCPQTLARYRDELELRRPGHPWARLSDEDLLLRLGACAAGDDAWLHPTRAGLVMFGWEYRIVDEFPFYFLDYRERGEGRRWEDRLLSSDGEWSGNVYDFWLRSSRKLVAELKRPFGVDEQLLRVDDTPMHRALREGLTNMLLHADYDGAVACTVVRERGQVTFTNPGTMLVPPEVAMCGGLSLTRNPTLARMFNLVAVGEKAGSGFDAMKEGCAWANADGPVVEERYGPDKVVLVVPLGSSGQAGAPGVAAAGGDGAFGPPTTPVAAVASAEERLLYALEESGSLRRVDVEGLLRVSKASANKLLRRLVEEGKVQLVGTGRASSYRLADGAAAGGSE